MDVEAFKAAVDMDDILNLIEALGITEQSSYFIGDGSATLGYLGTIGFTLFGNGELRLDPHRSVEEAKLCYQGRVQRVQALERQLFAAMSYVGVDVPAHVPGEWTAP